MRDELHLLMIIGHVLLPQLIFDIFCFNLAWHPARVNCIAQLHPCDDGGNEGRRTALDDRRISPPMPRPGAAIDAGTTGLLHRPADFGSTEVDREAACAAPSKWVVPDRCDARMRGQSTRTCARMMGGVLYTCNCLVMCKSYGYYSIYTLNTTL